MKTETIAKIFLLTVVGAAAIFPFAWQHLTAAPSAAAPTLVIEAAMPENGGWQPEVISAQVGVPLHLRITSSDVQHSFVVAQMEMQPVQVAPGEWKDVELTFEQPGKYTYYCTRWCGAEHWRMRGVIEVSGEASGENVPTEIAQPLYLALNMDVDAPHMAASTPPAAPDLAHGAELLAKLPAYTLERQTYLISSPAALWQRLRDDTALAEHSDAHLWDAVSAAWQSQTSPQQIETGRALFAENCAACHGESGQGDGVILRDLPPFEHETMMSGHGRTRPPDLSDPAVTLGASPALLEGKIIRGGMGTGMPMWGNIFTQPQIDALVGYLYTLVEYDAPATEMPAHTP